MSGGSRPTLAELRARVQKQRYQEIGNWLARRVARPSAIYGTWLAVRFGLSAHQVTLLAMLTAFASAAAIGLGNRWGFVVGVGLAHLAFWLDHVDGQVARWNGTASLDGVFFDYLLHYAWNLSLGFGLGFGIAQESRELGWTVVGFLLASGLTFLNLCNDCRYKAFFQRLKSHAGSFRVVGGAGGRPAPPARWPRRGWGMLTWPAQKLCELHAVLIILSILVLIAIGNERAWWLCLRVWVCVLAFLAPLLALARMLRMLSRSTTEVEFDQWFRPLD